MGGRGSEETLLPGAGSELPRDPQPRSCPQAVSVPEEAPAESAPEKPSDPGEEGAAEDPVDPGGRGGPGGKKESASGKAAPDGKLVKGTRPGLPGVPDVRARRVGLSQGPLAQPPALQGGARAEHFEGLVWDFRASLTCRRRPRKPLSPRQDAAHSVHSLYVREGFLIHQDRQTDVTANTKNKTGGKLLEGAEHPPPGGEGSILSCVGRGPRRRR